MRPTRTSLPATKQVNTETLNPLATLFFLYRRCPAISLFLQRFFANLAERHIIITQTEIIKGKRWPFKCSAGKENLVLESDGTMRVCELTSKIGNLIDNSPEELLKSEQAKNIFKMITGDIIVLRLLHIKTLLRSHIFENIINNAVMIRGKNIETVLGRI